MDVPREDLRPHPDSVTGADVFAVPDESLSPTDPAELVPWLRALPVGSVLLDKNEVAFQVWELAKHEVVYPALLGGGIYHRNRDSDMRDLCRLGPFRVLWTSAAAELASTGRTNRSVQPARPRDADQAH